MPICFFNKKYDEKFECQYNIKNDGIEIEIKYDIMNEIEAINGIRYFGTDTKFDKRDILLIDSQTQSNFLIKNAEYFGDTEVFGSPDGGCKAKFFSNIYFKDNSYEKLQDISGNNIQKIRIYSSIINEFIGYPNLEIIDNDTEYTIKLKRDASKQEREIAINNISCLKVSDTWKGNVSGKNSEINIMLGGYIEIILDKAINYEEVYEYVYELVIYFQLLKPYKTLIKKITVDIDNYFYELCIPIEKFKYKNSNIKNSVEVSNILDFLLKCYTEIPYRNSKNEIRNIPYIILENSRNIEDNFLMFYRFIECYYKQQSIKDIQKNFIKYSIENNYLYKFKINEDIDELTQEIICLRNHYVHNGYHIPNKKLYVAFPKIDKKSNPKNHMVENIDFEWLYKRTKLLYQIVIDIIFKNMLKYDKYEFNGYFGL